MGAGHRPHLAMPHRRATCVQCSRMSPSESLVSSTRTRNSQHLRKQLSHAEASTESRAWDGRGEREERGRGQGQRDPASLGLLQARTAMGECEFRAIAAMQPVQASFSCGYLRLSLSRCSSLSPQPNLSPAAEGGCCRRSIDSTPLHCSSSVSPSPPLRTSWVGREVVDGAQAEQEAGLRASVAATTAAHAHPPCCATAFHSGAHQGRRCSSSIPLPSSHTHEAAPSPSASAHLCTTPAAAAPSLAHHPPALPPSHPLLSLPPPVLLHCFPLR